MKNVTILFLIILAAGSVGHAEPIKLQDDSKIGVVNLVGDETKNCYWGFTAFNNFCEEIAVDWDIRGYIDEGIKRRIENSSNYEVVIINDAADREAFQQPMLNAISRFTRNAKVALSEARKKYDIDILIWIVEGLDYVGGKYVYGYGVHGWSDRSFIHSNISLHSIDLKNTKLFFPSSLGRSPKPLKGITEVPVSSYINKEEKSYKLDDSTKIKVQGLVDGSLDWYFSQYPVDPPLKR